MDLPYLTAAHKRVHRKSYFMANKWNQIQKPCRALVFFLLTTGSVYGNGLVYHLSESKISEILMYYLIYSFWYHQGHYVEWQLGKCLVCLIGSQMYTLKHTIIIRVLYMFCENKVLYNLVSLTFSKSSRLGFI